ncbi:outer membrane protein assembly factor BamE [Gammaproteobacteria bacterium]
MNLTSQAPAFSRGVPDWITEQILTMRSQNLIFLALLPLILGACASFSFPYRTDVQQGNVITQDMMERLRTGMNQREVRYLLGSPLLRDPFHPDRWDYHYSLEKDGFLREQRRLTLYFNEETLARIEE